MPQKPADLRLRKQALGQGDHEKADLAERGGACGKSALAQRKASHSRKTLIIISLR